MVNVVADKSSVEASEYVCNAPSRALCFAGRRRN